MIYSERVVEAFRLSFTLHKSQHRKSTPIPYITHLLSVAAIVGEFGGDEDQFIAALLHDAAEDQGGFATLDLIRAQFGERVAGYVHACSDTLETPKPEWRPRKEGHVTKIAQASPELKLIVAADKLHNVRCTEHDLRIQGSEIWSRFTGGCDGMLWYYRQMLGALRNGWTHVILDTLEEAIQDLHATAQVLYPERPAHPPLM